VADVRRARVHLGLDLGGTNIKWVVAAHDGDWRTLDRGEAPTHADAGPDAVIARLASLGRAATDRYAGVGSAGIGVPGPYDPRAGTVRDLTNFPGDWAGRPLASIVGDALGMPAHLINDARAFGLAELRLGAGRGASSMVGITLGTGLGGVIAIDGRIHQGHDGSAGELGHQTIVPDGPPCNCGNRGCLEAFVRADRIATMCGAPSADEAATRARAGDAAAMAGMAEVGRYLGIGLANVITIVTPDRVVIGGGGAAAFDLLIGPIARELARRVRMTSLDQVRVVPAELGVWAGAIGAAIHGAEAGRSTPA
jgi:glucokinase